MVFTFIPIKVYDYLLSGFFCFLLHLSWLALLPDGRFDIALLVPLPAPVLSLQHIIFPICRAYKGLYEIPFQ